MSERSERIIAVQHILAGIFSAQRALRALAPEYKWAGLGNLLGDFGELVAVDHYQLQKAPGGSDGFDALTAAGKSVQIKTNYAADQIGFRGTADLMLVIGVSDDGSWEELNYGPFKTVLQAARYSARDNKRMVAVTKLPELAAANQVVPLPPV